MDFTVETEQEDDGRWLAEVLELAGVFYGQTQAEAIANVQALAFQVLADWLINKPQGLPSHTEVLLSSSK